MTSINPLSGLITQLSKLPGVGEKSAQRLAFFILGMPKEEVRTFSSEIIKTRESIRYCQACFNISLQETCHICLDSQRDSGMLCIVSEPREIFALERSAEYRGYYHVLGGLLSPLDGIYPESLRIQELVERLKERPFKEVVLGINSSIEGDATKLYLTSVLKQFNVKVTQLAYGLPVGGDIDYVDELTLQRALIGRQDIE